MYVISKFGIVRSPAPRNWGCSTPLSNWGDLVAPLKFVSANVVTPAVCAAAPRKKYIRDWIFQAELFWNHHTDTSLTAPLIFLQGEGVNVRQFTKWPVTQPRIIRFRSKFGTEFNLVTSDVQGHVSKVKVTAW